MHTERLEQGRDLVRGDPRALPEVCPRCAVQLVQVASKIPRLHDLRVASLGEDLTNVMYKSFPWILTSITGSGEQPRGGLGSSGPVATGDSGHREQTGPVIAGAIIQPRRARRLRLRSRYRITNIVRPA
jgi:hypothetical protein